MASRSTSTISHDRLYIVVVLLAVTSAVSAHTWLLEPPAHYSFFPRNAILDTPCEPWSKDYKPKKVKAGDEITVRWAPLGHSGGYIRLALAPATSLNMTGSNGAGWGPDFDTFNQNVVKHACYGGGKGPDKYADSMPYNTSFVVPTNLADGTYVLQMWAVATGTANPSTFSCTDLQISGGDPSLSCPRPPSTNQTADLANLSKCWSCYQTDSTHEHCQRPELTSPGIGFTYGAFCYPSSPNPLSPSMRYIGHHVHQVGLGDTFLGIAKTFQCCCTATDIASYTGWGDAVTAITEDQGLIAGKKVIVPFFAGRKGCTPADPATFNAGVTLSPRLSLVLGSLLVVLATLGFGL